MPNELLVKYRTAARATTASSPIPEAHVKKILNGGIHHLRLPRAMTVQRAIERLKDDPDVEYAEPNYYRFLTDTIPSDAYFSQLWGLYNTGQLVNGTPGTAGADIKAVKAWDLTTGSTTVIVALIDTGVDYNHPDLASNIWTNPGEIPGNGIDDDSNGYIDDVRGWDFMDNDNDPMDSEGHGSHVAGIISAQGNNGIGITGVCWQVKIMPLRAANSLGYFTTATIVSAINYAVRNGAKIINASFGGPSYSLSEYNAINAARLAGVLFVAAAGNDTSNNDTSPTYPANYALANVISVASTNQNDGLSWFSNHGSSTVHVGAPGENIYSARPARQTVYSDNFDSGSMAGWTTGGTNDTWGLSTSHHYSGGYSLAVSPAANYQNGTDSWARTVLDLSGKSGATLSFRLQGRSETNSDFLYVEASTDLVTWTNQEVLLNYPPNYPIFDSGISGNYSNWYAAEVDLGAYDGKNPIYLRFHFTSNGSTTYQGFFLDDIVVSTASATYAGTEYIFMSGTSMAAPHVAGLAALLWSYDGSLTMAQVKTRILQGVDPKPSLSGKVSSGGRINAYNALMNQGVPSSTPVSSTPSGGGGGGGGCFIATAAYGSPMQPCVVILQKFRDVYLLGNRPGRAFVALYYRYSPSAARLIAERPVLRRTVALCLLPFVAMGYSFLILGPIPTVTLFALLLPCFVFIIRLLIPRRIQK